MKKLLKIMGIAAIFASVLSFGFVGCGGSSDDDDEPAPKPPKTGAAYDNVLRVKLDSAPTLGATGTVTIYKGDTLVDTVAVKDEVLNVISGSNGKIGKVKVDDQLIVVEGNDIVITPHTDDSGYSKLEAGIKYTVKISEDLLATAPAAGYEVATKGLPTIEGNAIKVGGSDGDFETIQGALNYMKSNNASGDWTVTVASGKYHEYLAYSGAANLKLVGSGNVTADGDTRPYVYWRNSQNLGNGQRSRQSFIWQGGNLTIENMIFENTTTRAVEGNTNVQAETLYFDCNKDLVVYNSKFYSYQDTLLIGTSSGTPAYGGHAWFYKCEIAGDVDFIWGYATVALFEDCKIVCRNDGVKGNAEIFASRTPIVDKTGKGFVLLNSEIAVDEGCDAYYGRSSAGGDSQATVLNCVVTGGNINAKLWNTKNEQTDYDPAGDAAIAFKSYNNKKDDAVISTAGKLTGTEDLSERVANREYNGRWVILNRVFDRTTKAYENAATIWDINTIAAAYEAPADDSVNNIFVDPVYKKNLVSTVKNFKVTASAAAASGITFTYETSNPSVASVDTEGNITPVEGAEGEAIITVTASNGKTDKAVIQVIPKAIEATALKFTEGPQSLNIYETAEVSMAFEPADASFTNAKWVVSGNIKIIDESKKNVVTEWDSTDATATVKIIATGTGTGTLTVTATDNLNAAATPATASVSIDNVICYNAVDAHNLQQKDLYGILNFQNTKSGIWHDIVIEGRESNSKIDTGTNLDCAQTRGVNLYIPVSGSKQIDIVCKMFKQSDPDSPADFKDGAGIAPEFTFDAASTETYKYHYTFKYNENTETGRAKTVSGADLKTAFDGWTKDTNRTLENAVPDETKTYFKIEVGKDDRYWTKIIVSDYTPPADQKDISITFADTTTVELYLSDADHTVTRAATLSGGDKGSATVSYSSSEPTVASVDGNGLVTALAVGETTITATESLTNTTATYKVVVKPNHKTALDAGTYSIRDLADAKGYADDSGEDGCISWSSLVANGDWAKFASGGTVKLKVSGACEITWNSYDGISNFTVVDSAATPKTLVDNVTSSDTNAKFIYTGTEATELTITEDAGKYVKKVTVRYPDTGETLANGVASVVISGGSSNLLKGTTMQLSASATAKYINNVSGTDVDTSTITWNITDGATAADVSNAGLVTAKSEITENTAVTVTATCGTATGTKNFTVTTVATTKEDALWDWQTLKNVSLWTDKECATESKNGEKYSLEGKEGYMKGSSSNVIAYVDASTSGAKLENSGSYVQFNTGTKIQIPVSAGSVLTVVAYGGQGKYTIGGYKSDTSSSNVLPNTVTCTASKAGYIEILAVGGAYIYAIKVTNVDYSEAHTTPVTISDDDSTVTTGTGTSSPTL